jgi:zinc transport system substrate-binding protein
MGREFVLVLAAVAVAFAASAAYIQQPAAQPAEAADPGSRLSVAASFYPVQYFAQEVAGDRADVTNLVPVGLEPHDWEPSPGDMERLESADVVLYMGVGLEPWVEKAEENSRDPSRFSAVSDDIELMLSEHGAHEEDGHEEEAMEGGDGSLYDPHIWLDPVKARQIVDNIESKLSSADPDGSEQYKSNAAALKERLDRMDAKFREGLSECEKSAAITSHAAFSYLLGRYGFEQLPVSGISHEDEPSAGKMAELVGLAREHGLKYVFYETLISPKISDTIAREVGAQSLVLNPIEGLTQEELERGEDWESVMMQNLNSLRTGLECK